MAATAYQIIQRAAEQLGLIHALPTITGTNPYTADDIKDIAVDDQELRWNYLARDTGTDWPEWRLLSATDISAGELTAQRDFSTDPTTGHLFRVLSPQEWMDALNAALPRLYYRDRATVTLVAGTSEYDVTTGNTWLTRKNQVIRTRFRNTAVATDPREGEVPAVYFNEANEALTALIPGALPSDVANTSLIIEARRYHEVVTAFTDPRTGPLSLLAAETKWEGLKKLFSKLGINAKRNYGQAMVLAEREVAEAESRFLDKDTKRDWSDEIEPSAGDPAAAVNWGW